jgi:CHAT domain-containing protein
MRRLALLVTATCVLALAPARADSPDGGSGLPPGFVVPPGVSVQPLPERERLRYDLGGVRALVLLGQHDEAARLATETRAAFEKLHDAEGVCLATGLLGGVYANSEHYDLAIAQYREAQKCASPRQRVDLDAAIASVRIDSGDLLGARAGYESVLAALPKDALKKQVEALGQLGWIAFTLGELERADELYKRADDVYKKFAATPSEEQWHLDFWLRRRRVWYDAARGHVDLAVQTMKDCTDYADDILREQMVEMTEREMLQAKYMVEYELETSIALDVAYGTKNAAATRLALTQVLRTKGLALEALAERQRLIRASSTPTVEKMLVELGKLRAELARLTLTGQVAKNARAYLELQNQADGIEMRAYNIAIETEYRTRLGPQEVKFDDVQAAVPAGAALVELERYKPFVPHGKSEVDRWGAPRYVAYVLFHSGDPRVVDLGDAKELDALALAFRQALATPQGDARRAGRALDARLMEPVRPLLGDARRLYVAPAGMLNLVPFDALVDDQGAWLAQRFTISYVASGRDLRVAESHKSRGPALVIGGANFDGKAQASAREQRSFSGDLRRVYFPSLPGTAGEAAAIGGLLDGARVLTGRAATKQALEQVHGPRVLHVATHAFFIDVPPPAAPAPASTSVPGKRPQTTDNPLLRAGLALAGANLEHTAGIVTALEAAGLDLDGTRLVVLSACETGVGGMLDDEGVAGLLRALMVAGAETQVVSLWKVDDQATRKLMVDYYGRLKKGEGRAAAMQDVRLAMMGRAATRHPYYWASFAVWGRGGPLDGSVK